MWKHFASHEPTHPLTPSLSPTGGEGVRLDRRSLGEGGRTGEEDRRGFMASMRVQNWRSGLLMKAIDRRSFLKNSLLGATAVSLAGQQPSASLTAAGSAPVPSEPPGIIDTNVNLFNWPF